MEQGEGGSGRARGDIVVVYTSLDGVRKRRVTRDLALAQAFAWKWVGRRPDLAPTYAVSVDGVGKVEVCGASLGEIFPEVAS